MTMSTTIPKRVHDRLAEGVRKFQPILAAAKSRDIGESDTVTIIKDMLADLFGYDKYSEITAEHAIRGTYCDLAIHLDGRLHKLIEVKAIGIDLKDQHVKQSLDYAANQGCDWVSLTNGVVWRMYKLAFTKPIDAELVFEFDFLTINPRSEEHLALLFLLCREGWAKSVLGEFHAQKQVLSRFFIAALLQSEPALDALRKEMRKLSPEIRVDNEEIAKVLVNEVLKREVIEGDKAAEAKKRVAAHYRKQDRLKAASKADKSVSPDSPTAVSPDAADEVAPEPASDQPDTPQP